MFRSDRLEKSRTDLHLSIPFVSEVAGVDPDVIKRFETGEQIPDQAQIALLSNLYGCSPAYFHQPKNVIAGLSTHDSEQVKNLLSFQRRISLK